jgi:hypothetical protein
VAHGNSIRRAVFVVEGHFERLAGREVPQAGDADAIGLAVSPTFS